MSQTTTAPITALSREETFLLLKLAVEKNSSSLYALAEKSPFYSTVLEKQRGDLAVLISSIDLGEKIFPQKIDLHWQEAEQLLSRVCLDQRNLPLLKWLVERGIDISLISNERQQDGMNIFTTLIDGDDAELLKFLVTDCGLRQEHLFLRGLLDAEMMINLCQRELFNFYWDHGIFDLTLVQEILAYCAEEGRPVALTYLIPFLIDKGHWEDKYRSYIQAPALKFCRQNLTNLLNPYL